jgi:hypothetical protein
VTINHDELQPSRSGCSPQQFILTRLFFLMFYHSSFLYQSNIGSRYSDMYLFPPAQRESNIGLTIKSAPEGLGVVFA